MDTAPIRKLWWLAGDGTVNQLPWYCPGECIRRVCSRWLREIDICELQGYWSAALALRADAVRQVEFAQLSVEPADRREVGIYENFFRSTVLFRVPYFMVESLISMKFRLEI